MKNTTNNIDTLMLNFDEEAFKDKYNIDKFLLEVNFLMPSRHYISKDSELINVLLLNTDPTKLGVVVYSDKFNLYDINGVPSTPEDINKLIRSTGIHVINNDGYTLAANRELTRTVEKSNGTINTIISGVGQVMVDLNEGIISLSHSGTYSKTLAITEDWELTYIECLSVLCNVANKFPKKELTDLMLNRGDMDIDPMLRSGKW